MDDRDRKPVVPEAEDELDTLKMEVAQELGLDDDLQDPDELTVREAGKIGGQMVKRLVAEGEKALVRKNRK